MEIRHVWRYIWDNFVYYYSITCKREREPAYAAGFALGSRVRHGEKVIPPSLPRHVFINRPSFQSYDGN
jgi:hypothetical protein